MQRTLLAPIGSDAARASLSSASTAGLADFAVALKLGEKLFTHIVV